MRGPSLLLAALVAVAVAVGLALWAHSDRTGGTTTVVQLRPVDAQHRVLRRLQTVDGGRALGCTAGSDSVGDAYRCVAEDGVHDPCWAGESNGRTLDMICQQRPWDGRVTRLALQGQTTLPPFLASPAPTGERGEPWGVQLTTGERCLALQGAHETFDERHVVQLRCARRDGRVLLRGIDRSDGRWKIDSAVHDARTGRYRLTGAVRLAIAWYAAPDDADALMARANACTAGALAYAAQSYEAARGGPDGPQPQLIAHACHGGFAGIVYAQPAPPGYEAAMFLRATSAGWQVLGVSETLVPAQSGIPVRAARAIGSRLWGTLGSEHVPF